TELSLPGPPLLVKLRLGVPRKASSTDCGCRRSISSRVMTVTAANASSTVCAVRLAEITIGGSGTSCAAARDGKATAKAAAKRRLFMDSPCCAHPRLPVRDKELRQEGTGDRPTIPPTAALGPGARRPGSRPVSGLTSRAENPGPAPPQACAQWRRAGPCLGYGCGGSAGFGPGSPFHPEAGPREPGTGGTVAGGRRGRQA